MDGNEKKARREADYKTVAERFPGFSWSRKTWEEQVQVYDAQGRKTGATRAVTRSTIVWENFPTIKGNKPTLEQLLTLELSAFDQWAPKDQRCVQQLVDLGPEGADFARVLLDLPIALPPEEVMQAVAQWFTRARSGEDSTVFSGVCPDYAVDAEGRYTFSALGCGVGLVAQRVQKAIGSLWDCFKKCGFHVTFAVAISDAEADSAENCARMGLTREAFRDQLHQSQDAFRSACDPKLPILTPFATEIGNWAGTLARATCEAAEGKMTGALTLRPGDFEAICKARASLYERWYGAGVDAAEILRRDIPQYMTMGDIATESFRNALILGADAPAMSCFLQGTGEVIRPVIYLKRVDY